MRPQEQISFKQLVDSLPYKETIPRTIFAIDPGETTGIAVFYNLELIYHKQIVTSNKTDPSHAAFEIGALLSVYKPNQVVIEEYRVYSWKAKDHAWSDLFTVRLIGALEYVCTEKKIPLIKQSAQIAKNFATDHKLKSWGFWIKGEKHSRDAIRHGIVYIIHKAKHKLKPKKCDQ